MRLCVVKRAVLLALGYRDFIAARALYYVYRVCFTHT